MHILVIGGGGREHALGWKLQQSPQCEKLFFAPGNAGTATLGTNVPLIIEPVNTKNAEAIDYFCREHDIGLVVIGPEDPLAEGLADRLTRPGRVIFGPSAAAARLEADKAYAKQLMRSAAIPTAEAQVFKDPGAAIHYAASHETPVVVKAAGLAKGKGVTVCDNADEAVAAVKTIMGDRVHGAAGDKVVIEERLVGQEVSVLALVDGRNIYVLDSVQDHKQVGEGDTGPNTGGMGAYCPTPLIDQPLMVQIERDILVPTVAALHREGTTYQGVLYAGLMLTAGGPKVLEFNCRFGDPETQALMLRLQGDLVALMCATAEGHLDEVTLGWDHRCCCCVVMASNGYPGTYEKSIPISGLEQFSHADLQIFHSGTTLQGDAVVTAGGRVLSVCALGDDLAEAQRKANGACEKIRFEGAFFRRDIGFRVMNMATATGIQT